MTSPGELREKRVDLIFSFHFLHEWIWVLALVCFCLLSVLFLSSAPCLTLDISSPYRSVSIGGKEWKRKNTGATKGNNYLGNLWCCVPLRKGANCLDSEDNLCFILFSHLHMPLCWLIRIWRIMLLSVEEKRNERQKHTEVSWLHRGVF